VVPGRLLAGEYPGDPDPGVGADRLERFRAAGVRLFVDLTEPFELEPYEHLVGEGRYERRPIEDFGTTSRRRYREILDLVDEGLEEGGVYVHCYRGLGRTGTVVGCWLVRHGLDDGDALARLTELRRDLPDAYAASPQTRGQRHVVTRWKRGH
jgi:protein-tyrosine phosphatase